jgi:hypothetical protein
VNFFLPGPADDVVALLKAQQEARRKHYQSAAREYTVLRAAIDPDCQLNAISVNISGNNYNRQRGEGFNVSGNFNFRVTLK